MVKSEVLTVVATLVCLALIACGDPGTQVDQEQNAEGQLRTASPAPPAAVVPVVSEATLPAPSQRQVLSISKGNCRCGAAASTSGTGRFRYGPPASVSVSRTDG